MTKVRATQIVASPHTAHDLDFLSLTLNINRFHPQQVTVFIFLLCSQGYFCPFWPWPLILNINTVHPVFDQVIAIIVHCQPDLYPMTLNMNRVHLIIGNMYAKLDQDTVEVSFCTMYVTTCITTCIWFSLCTQCYFHIFQHVYCDLSLQPWTLKINRVYSHHVPSLMKSRSTIQSPPCSQGLMKWGTHTHTHVH